jgi:hypothetical protein
MPATPADVKAAFQNAIPNRRDEFERRINARLKSIVHEDGYVRLYPKEVLVMASDELRARITIAADRVKQLINAGWTADQMVTVRNVFLECFGTFDRMDKDPQSDLYRAVEAAFTEVGAPYDTPQAIVNARRLSEVQVQASTEFLSDLELYYAERHPTTVVPTNTSDERAVADAVAHWKTDAFICHASEDKAFVRELAHRLRGFGVRVWFDEAELTLGDSLRGKIDEGLQASQYGIVVLSKSFFEKPWPQSELDALVEIQNASGRKVILPVWLDVTVEDVRSKSPLLAARLATKSSDGPAKVVDDLLKVLRANSVPATPGSPAQAAPQFPDFHAALFEIQHEDPVLSDDMHVALIVEVLNNGAESVCKGFKVSALTPYGRKIDADVFSNDGFRLMVNKGRDCFNYRPEHFLMNRTATQPVKRGTPVSGVLPCIFRGTTDARDIDLRTLTVEFADGIGDANGQRKWWRTSPIESVQWEDPIVRKHRPGLPSLEQPCGSGSAITQMPDTEVEQLQLITKLAARLESLANEADTPPDTSQDSVTAFVSWSNRNKELFDRLSPDLIRATTNIRLRYGFSDSALTDEKLTASFVPPGDMRSIADGLRRIAARLSDKIATRSN